MIDWRDTHRWLRGYSDAKLGKAKTAEFEKDENYLRGYAVGEIS